MLGLLAQAPGGFPKLAADGSIFLIVGGLCMLGLVVLLVILRTVFPSGKPRAGGMITGKLPRHALEAPSVPQAPRSSATTIPHRPEQLQEGIQAARRFKPHTIDDVLDYIVSQRWANPRLLRLREQGAVLRYYGCSECSPRTQTEISPATPGCGFQAGFLRVAFAKLAGDDVQVHEYACRAYGQSTCEFEVRYL